MVICDRLVPKEKKKKTVNPVLAQKVSSLCPRRRLGLGARGDAEARLNVAHLCLHTSGDLEIGVDRALIRVLGPRCENSFTLPRVHFKDRDSCCFKRNS